MTGTPTDADLRASLTARRDSLYDRLEAGYAMIDRLLAEGKDVTAREDFWIAMLGEYEATCNALRARGWPTNRGKP